MVASPYGTSQQLSQNTKSTVRSQPQALGILHDIVICVVLKLCVDELPGVDNGNGDMWVCLATRQPYHLKLAYTYVLIKLYIVLERSLHI